MNQIPLPSSKYIYDDVIGFEEWSSSDNYGAIGIRITYKHYPAALLLYTSKEDLRKDLAYLSDRYGKIC